MMAGLEEMMGKKQYLTEDAKWGYLLIAPTIIGLIVLNVYPFLQTLVLSFPPPILWVL